MRTGCGIRSRITKYNHALRFDSTKCSLPHLAVSFSGGKRNNAVIFESQRKARRRFTHPPRTKMAPVRVLIFVFAEDVGFEPTRSFTLWRFSKPLPSATRPILRYIHFVQTVALREDWPGVCHAWPILKQSALHSYIHI